jgi:hypothetical protein
MTTKTISKKVEVKKIPAKKGLKPSMSAIMVPGELAFWTIDGKALHSLAELADALKVMEGRVYRYHADKDHQDFAAWVGTVFHYKAEAKLLRSATTAKAAEKIIRTLLKTAKG